MKKIVLSFGCWLASFACVFALKDEQQHISGICLLLFSHLVVYSVELYCKYEELMRFYEALILDGVVYSSVIPKRKGLCQIILFLPVLIMFGGGGLLAFGYRFNIIYTIVGFIAGCGTYQLCKKQTIDRQGNRNAYDDAVEYLIKGRKNNNFKRKTFDDCINEALTNQYHPKDDRQWLQRISNTNL